MMVLCVFEDFVDIFFMCKKVKKLRVKMVFKSFLVYFFDDVKCNDLINLYNIFGVIGKWIFRVLYNCCVFL